jgi:DNA repair exonuclease SbcCD ATPase subunit
MNIQQVEASLVQMQSHYAKAQGKKELLESSLGLAQEKLEQIKKDIAQGELVQALFTKTSEYARVQLKQRIEATVTAGIQAIFQNDDEFFVEMGEFRGQPAADWQVKTKGGVVDPHEADGGGLSDTVSTTLRLSIIETARPKPGGPVLLDEPGRNLSGQSSGSDYLPNMAVFLKEYARQTGRSLLIVTHEEPLMEMADAAYRVVQKDGISEVKKV